MNQKMFNKIVAGIFLVIGALHALRIIYGWPAVIGGLAIPIWASWLALLVSAGLAYQGFKLSKS